MSLIFFQLFAFNRVLRKSHSGTSTRKNSNTAELTFGFYATREKKAFTCAPSKNKVHKCLTIFV